MRIVFATVVRSHQHSRCLTRADAYNRLLSFYELRDVREGWLEHFLTTGYHPETGRKPARRLKSMEKRRKLALVKRLQALELLPAE